MAFMSVWLHVRLAHAIIISDGMGGQRSFYSKWRRAMDPKQYPNGYLAVRYLTSFVLIEMPASLTFHSIHVAKLRMYVGDDVLATCTFSIITSFFFFWVRKILEEQDAKTRVSSHTHTPNTMHTFTNTRFSFTRYLRLWSMCVHSGRSGPGHRLP